MKINERNIFYLFLIFITITPFIGYTYIFLGLESSYLFLLLLVNKKFILYRKNSLLNSFYLIPAIILLFGYEYETAVGTAMKFLLGIIIIMQFDNLGIYFGLTKKYFNIFSNILVFSILFEMIFTNIFFMIFRPIFEFIIGTSGTTMIYNNALSGIYYGIIPDSATACGVLLVSLAFLTGKTKYQLTDYIRVCLYILCIILTSKRGPLIFSLIPFVYFFCKGRYRFSLKKFLLVLFITICGIIILVIVFPQLNIDVGIGRIVNTILHLGDESNDLTSGRNDLSEFALALFDQNKLFGAGWSRFSSLYKQHTFKSVLNVHNVYLQLLSEVGIIGTIVCIFPFFKSLVTLFKPVIKSSNDNLCKRTAQYYLIFNLLYMLTGCFFDMPFYYLSLLLLIDLSSTRKE